MFSLTVRACAKQASWIATSFVLWVLPLSAAGNQPEAAQPDVAGILRRSLEVTRADWQHQSNMVDVERDADSQDGKSSSKTYQVMMIDGTPYNHLIARDGKPLPHEEAAHQTQLLAEETAKRANESPDERAKRVGKYHHSQERVLNMMQEMTRAMNYTFDGRSTLNGHQVIVLNATPKPGYQPPTRESKVLTGMAGKLWIDEDSYQWVRVEAQVIKPVSFGFFVAKVYPGTRFLLEQEPIQANVWMPAHFQVQVKSTVLMVHKDFTHDEIYRDYRLLSSLPSDLNTMAEQ